MYVLLSWFISNKSYLLTYYIVSHITLSGPLNSPLKNHSPLSPLYSLLSVNVDFCAVSLERVSTIILRSIFIYLKLFGCRYANNLSMFNTQQNPISFNIVCSVKYLRYNRSLSILTNNMYQIIRILCDLVQICFSH